MPWSEIGEHALALVLYPGAVTMLAIGVIAEAAAGWALVPARGPFAAWNGVAAALRTAFTRGRPPALASIALLMTMLAATQLAIPFNPVPSTDRNLLIAAVAIAGAGWVTWAWGWNRDELEPRLMLLGQAGWLAALLAPSVSVQTLRPEAVGSVILPGLTAVKVVAAILYVISLPALLQLIPESAPQGVPGARTRRRDPEEAGFALVRVLLWLPVCGLFTSVIFPPSADDALGIVRFLVLSGAAGAVGLALAANLIHRGALFTHRRYGFALAALGMLTIAVALVSVAVQQTTVI